MACQDNANMSKMIQADNGTKFVDNFFVDIVVRVFTLHWQPELEYPIRIISSLLYQLGVEKYSNRWSTSLLSLLHQFSSLLHQSKPNELGSNVLVLSVTATQTLIL